ncbi:MAG: SRPBCC family protein [Acidimicrobiales bacterium]
MTSKKPRAFPAAHDGMTSVDPDGRAVLRFERELRHSVERVWAAVTQPEEMVAWFAHRVEIDPQVGGRLTLWLGDSSAPDPVQAGTVTVFDPFEAFETVFEDGSSVRFELQESVSGCLLIFTDTRPIGERARNSVLAGWHLRMDQLPDALEGRPTDWLALDADRDEHGFVAAIAEIYWHYRNQERPTNVASGNES